ncbi:hypothetical protein BpHYR1_030492 [Brachionus plicatilis]|uniref:G-protein coupled receptors family 1 profile domain-containing protein n=1 Tax=Brachionus plicatilis TaxID=10195 RepID=A0A3M7R7T9_BRAPC|nr:hypothetical protein BpHYR1_030492 [Brachionus plicatilis]
MYKLLNLLKFKHEPGLVRKYQMSEFILNLAKSINFYFSAVWVPAGIVFNLATILIFQSKIFYKTNIRIYYTALGVHDIVALSNSIFFLQLFPSLGYHFDSISNFMCKSILLWRRIVIQCPSWVQVIITYDRYKTICHPNSSRKETRTSIILKFLGLFAFMFFLNMVHLWYNLKETVGISTIYDNLTNQLYNLTRVSRICTASSGILLTTDIIIVLFRAYIPFLSRQKFKSNGSMSKKEYYFTFTIFRNALFFMFNLNKYLLYAIFLKLVEVHIQIKHDVTNFVTFERLMKCSKIFSIQTQYYLFLLKNFFVTNNFNIYKSSIIIFILSLYSIRWMFFFSTKIEFSKLREKVPSDICIYGFISNPSNHFIPQYYSKIDKDPKTFVSPLSTQTPTNRNPLRELNLQTNQTKSQISIASNIETCSNQLSPKKRGRKRLPRDENVFFGY